MTDKKILTTTKELIDKLGLKVDCELTIDDDVAVINLQGRDAQYLQQGRENRGAALVYMLKQILQHQHNIEPRIILDFNNERKQRLENISQMARKTAEMARVKGDEEELPPMTPAERRAVHIALKEMKGIKTESRGVEPHRRIVIIPDEDDI